MTNREVNYGIQATGSNVGKKYSLTITLSVNTHTAQDGTIFIGANTHIYRSPIVAVDGESRVANGSDDFCSLEFPHPYLIDVNNKGGIEGLCTNAYLYDISDHCAVAGFRENNGGTYMRASSSISKPSSTSKKRFISKYVHTWTSKTPGITVGNDAVTFSMTSSKDMWQIATYYDCTC